MGYFNFKNGETALNETNLKLMQVELAKMIFPIGSTYITQSDTNPSTILEFGTWERVKGKVLVGLDENDTDFNAIGKTGGEKTHTLTVEEMPNHNHPLGTWYNSASGSWGNAGANNSGTYQEDAITTSSTGGNQPHNNLQPYQVVGYMWIRTA